MLTPRWYVAAWVPAPPHPEVRWAPYDPRGLSGGGHPPPRVAAMTMGQATGRLITRDLTADDLDAAFDVRSRSFGRFSPSLREWWNDVQRESINAHRAIGVFDGERLLAHARLRSYQQFWGGRPMPMGGVAGVVVAPDARGRGVGTRLMTAVAQRSLERGDLVSALYPATIPIYRALGWEVVGAQ